MTGYLTEDEVLAMRLQGIPVSDTPTPCCAACRRGTRAHGTTPCGDSRCDCHRKETT